MLLARLHHYAIEQPGGARDIVAPLGRRGAEAGSRFAKQHQRLGWRSHRQRIGPLIQELATKLAQQHRVGRASLLGVILEARPLEILHRVELAVVWIDLAKLLGDREAKCGQPAAPLPEAAERPA